MAEQDQRAAVRSHGPWTERELARHQRIDLIQVRRDRERGVSANLAEAAALARFANRFAKAFEHARRA